jgi:hypothetical protein
MTGSRSIAYLIIESGGTIRQVFGPLGVKDAQNVLEGDFEVIQPRGIDVTMLVNMDGKAKGLNPNWLATALARSRLRPDDFIVGRAIITGLPDAEGELQPISVKAEEAIRRMAEK